MLLVAVLAALPAASFGREPDFREYRAVQESLARVPPKFRAEWLQKRGYDDSRYTSYQKPESTGLRLVGKYGRGPSVEVTGRDTLVALTLGSEVALLDFSNPDSPEVLSEIQLDYLSRQSLIKDSLFFTGGNGIQLWSISDPAQPVQRSVIPYAVSDFAIRDTLLYFIGSDSFQVYSIACTGAPYRIGCYRDSGSVTSVTASTAVIRGSGDYVAFADVANPASPRRVGSYGGWVLSAAARNNICCITLGSPGQPTTLTFRILDISNPATPFPLSSLDSCGGYDIFLEDSLAFISGYYTGGHEFRILSIRDSTRPLPLGVCVTPDVGKGVWANTRRGFALVADDFCGLGTIDITNLTSPWLRHSGLKAGLSSDIDVQDALAYVAQSSYGLKILDVSEPARPVEIGGIDSTRDMVTESAVARDSFAYMGWGQPPFLRSIDVTDPTSPRKAGGCAVFDSPRDMVLRDSLLYVAQACRFQVVNVARPRQPVLVGSCVTADVTHAGLCVRDTIAYIAYWPTEVINVADPTHPVKIGEFRRGADNIDVVDTLAFLTGGGLYVYNVANPANPVVVDSLGGWPYAFAVAMAETLAYVGCRDAVRLVNVSDPHNMRVVASSPVPRLVWKMTYAAPYVYAACFDAGVCIFEASSTGVSERPNAPAVPDGVRLLGSVTGGRVTLEFQEAPGKEVRLQLFDIVGNRIGRVDVLAGELGDGRRCLIDLSGRPAGVYVLQVNVGDRVYQLRMVKP